MKLHFSSLALLTLLGLANCSPLQPRANSITIKFDDISNAFPVPSDYNNLEWTNWDVRSPDRGQSSYVKYASPFQYGRVFADTVGRISRGSAVNSFAISKLRYGCSVPIPDGGFSPGVPKSCKVTVTANCANGNAQHATGQFSPSGPIAALGTLNAGSAISCTNAHSYTFTATGKNGQPVDLLIDNIVMKQSIITA